MACCNQAGRRGMFKGDIAVVTVAGIGGPCAQKAITHAFDALDRLAALTDRSNPDSDMGRIASADVADAVAVHPWTWHLVKAANEVAYRSDGLFDAVAVGSGGRATWTDLDLSRRGVLRPRKRLQVDLGGIIKGYAADIALKALKDFGVPAGLVDVGGRVAAYGPAAWRVNFRRCARCAESGRAETLPVDIRDGAVMAPKSFAQSVLLDTERGQFVSGLELAPGLHMVRAKAATVADTVTKIVALRPDSRAKMPALFDAEVTCLPQPGTLRRDRAPAPRALKAQLR